MRVGTGLVAAAAVISLSVSASFAADWTRTDASGNTVTVNHVPARIIAHANSAAALIPLGIRPIAIYADGPVATDMSLKGLDLTGIEIVGETWGQIDIEKVAALKPDLIVAEWWPGEKAYSGLEPAADDKSKTILQLAPITGVAQGASIVTMLTDYEELAQSLGADLSKPEIAADKARFEASRDAFKAAVAAKPKLTVEAIWAGDDGLYVAIPKVAAELSDFQSWGLKLIEPDTPDATGYWEILSWERADKYQPDLVLVDDRFETNLEKAKSQPGWTLLKAAAAGQVADWPAYWIRNYAGYAGALDKLTAAVAAADENLVE